MGTVFDFCERNKKQAACRSNYTIRRWALWCHQCFGAVIDKNKIIIKKHMITNMFAFILRAPLLFILCENRHTCTFPTEYSYIFANKNEIIYEWTAPNRWWTHPNRFRREFEFEKSKLTLTK